MKKALILLAATLLLASTTQAQFTHKGARFGMGGAYVADDFLTSGPILGTQLGVFANYGFESAQAFWADHLYLQFGANIARHGTKFDQELKFMRSYRHGKISNWYLDIPVMAAWRWELPIAQADHYLHFYVGPMFSVGLLGRYHDRCVTPGYPQSSMNYDTYLTDDKNRRRSFKNMRRIDAYAQLGIGYTHNNLGIDLLWQHGFVPLMREDDVLRQLHNSSLANGQGGNNSGNTNSADNKPDNRNAYTGTNQSFMLCVTYMLPWN